MRESPQFQFKFNKFLCFYWKVCDDFQGSFMPFVASKKEGQAALFAVPREG